LSQYAIEMVVRVLVLELIPLTAALFVALRCTLPSAAELAQMRARGEFDALQRAGIDPLRRELMPRVVAGSFAVLLLAAVSCALAMLLAYLSVYGFRTSAFPGFTRTLGQIFSPGVMMIFALKTLLFGGAVALIPVAATLNSARGAAASANTELKSLVRLFSVILLIEVVSLMGNYR
jgi:phospholipid/cholesterol/gamma-HCH transport system permease protein